jgi:hypothetical protein
VKLISLDNVNSQINALFQFHIASGGRVASRNAIATISLIIIVLGSAPDPLVWLRFLALGVAGAGAGSGPLIGLTLIAYALARDGVPRLTLGLGGWTRSLPLNGVQHRRGVMYGLPIIQLPLVASVLIAAVLTTAAYHQPLAFAKLLGAPLALVAAGAAVIPSRRWFAAVPLFGASALLAAFGRWSWLGVAVMLFIVADLTAGGLRFATARPAVASPAAPGALRMFRFTWRALGLRLIAPLPVSVLALAAAWFYSRNNELSPTDTAFVARLWTTIAIALYVGGVGDIIAARRPAWPWLRSLPWSSHDRAVDDAIAIGLPAVGIALASIVVDARTVIFAFAVLIPLSALAAALLRGARRRLTRVSGPLVIVGILVGTAGAFHPWIAAVAVLTTPLLLRLAARRDRREIVTGWRELYHDAAGDSLAWSAR